MRLGLVLILRVEDVLEVHPAQSTHKSMVHAENDHKIVVRAMKSLKDFDFGDRSTCTEAALS